MTQTVLLCVLYMHILYILYVINIKSPYFRQLANAGIAELTLLLESFIGIHIQRH